MTLRRFGPVGKRIGITRLADATGLDRVGLPVCLALRPTARSLVTSIGKGPTPAAAKVGALMESIETWHAEHLDLPTRTATPAELTADGERALDVTELPRAVGAVIDPHKPRSWVRGVDLSTRAPTWVPVDSVSMDFVAERLGEPGLARNSNGLASGNSLEQAMLHGLCEAVERDAESRWRASSDSYRVRLDTVDDPDCRQLIGMIDAAGLHLAAWDVTSHTGVPCYGCVVLAPPGLDGDLDAGVHDGFSCRPSPAAALAGAVEEALQKRLTYIAGSRDDLSREEVERVRAPELIDAVWDELAAEPADMDLQDRPTLATGTLAGDLRAVLRAVTSGSRHTVTAVDLTRPDAGVPVAKVIVTRMEGPFGMCAPASPDESAPGER
ncbi:YcaO-like protein with predicted kinase domain [Streptomyces phaeochromogenes]|uniref:YcaO-like family protein n=1 Tax=Streptomyces phaeochromogenes TaxID=1923 RepID=UPI002791DCBB|nr:YcaO-like family protein [Streptomyces phaeochromogenes]MDQ0950880.1 YcaO-like protein with predicted kinase domain [Streptomyces phaeochromogenes]